MAGFKKCALLIALFITVNACGRDIFVATDGNDNLNDGSTSQPYLTINKAASVAIAGDIVTIRSGTYMPSTRITAANSGTSGAPIIYRAEVQGGVIIDGSVSASPTSADRLGLFTILGADAATPKSWIVVDGLRIINSTWAGFYANRSSNIIFRNCSTFNTGSSGIIGAASSNITVLNNTVQRACQFPSTAQGTNECITMASVDGFEVGYNAVSDRMTDLNNGGEGIDAKNACLNGKIHHNIVFNMLRVGIYVDAYQRNLSNVEVYANKVYDCTRGGITVASEEGGIANGVKIHDNLVYNINRIGIRLAGYLNNGPLLNIDVYHNTVFNAGFGGGYENAGLLIEASNDANSGFNIRNNIISGCPQQIRSNNKQNFAVTVDNNLFFGAIGTFSANTTVSNTTNLDPLFVNTAISDFSLQPASPAIDRAAGSPFSVEDITGTARPVGGQSDLGAFESYSALPVTLRYFTGKFESGPENAKVALKWTTTSEINVSQYDIEKSRNGVFFTMIGSVPAKNLTEKAYYAFSDYEMNSKTQYYRLKMTDQDGSYEYSRIVDVQTSFEETENITIFPNPAVNAIVVQHDIFKSVDYRIIILNLNGRLVSTHSVATGANQTVIDVNKLTRGLYVVVFEGPGVKTTSTFVK